MHGLSTVQNSCANISSSAGNTDVVLYFKRIDNSHIASEVCNISMVIICIKN